MNDAAEVTDNLPPLFRKTANGRIQTWSIGVTPRADGTATIAVESGILGRKTKVEVEVVEITGDAAATLECAVHMADVRHARMIDRDDYVVDPRGE